MQLQLVLDVGARFVGHSYYYRYLISCVSSRQFCLLKADMCGLMIVLDVRIVERKWETVGG